MHAGLGFALVDEVGFGGGESGKAGADLFFGEEVFGEADVGAVVAGFGFEEAAVEVGQFTVGECIAEEGKTFAGAGFDEGGDQEAIDSAVGLVFADQLVQAGGVGRGTELVEADAAAVEDGADLMEVVKLLVDDLGHGAGQVGLLDVGEEQVHGHAGGFLFAVGVVDEEEVEMGLDLVEPAGGGWCCKAKHAVILRTTDCARLSVQWPGTMRQRL